MCTCGRRTCYQYKGFWIEVLLEPTPYADHFLYIAYVESPTGVFMGSPKQNSDEAEFAAEELIDSWD